MKKFILLFSLILMGSGAVIASTTDIKPKNIKWNFDGMLGTFDRTSIQRGFQVYKEVCSACHSLDLVAFRNLTEIGYSDAQAKEIAKEYSITAGPDDMGEMYQRPGILSDYFPNPYANSEMARASNNGAFPPDLSLIIRARQNGANYAYSLLTGFGQTPPKHMNIPDSLHYNPYFPGQQIAMAAPLNEGLVTYTDGTKASVGQMSRDVVNFLQWASDPKMEQRKGMGFKVLMFLLIFTGLFYVAKKHVWKDVK